MERRGFLMMCGASALGLLESRQARASTARALSVGDLVQKSTSVLVVTPLAQSSSFQTIAGTRRIVTDTRVRVEDLVTGRDPSQTEVVVRTLGGRVGTLGQLVEGEAELTLGEASLTFLAQLDVDWFGVTAMGQGHYPVRTDAPGRILRANRALPALVGTADAAVRKLPGHALAEAVELVRAVRR
jgi:hypothetical protein